MIDNDTLNSLIEELLGQAIEPFTPRSSTRVCKKEWKIYAKAAKAGGGKTNRLLWRIASLC